MVQSRSGPCKKTRDYEDMANLQEATLACGAILRGSNPFYSDLLHGTNNMVFVQRSAASVITGEVVVNEEGNKHGVTPLSAGVIAVVCISAIAVILICLCMSEMMNNLSWSRRQHNTSIFNRQDVRDNHSRAAPAGNVEVAGSNPSEAASSITGSNDSQVGGSKPGLAHWVIKGLPIIKYKKQQVLHPGFIISTNSSSSVEFTASGNVRQHSGAMIAAAELDHDIKSVPLAHAICNEAAPDYNRLECVVCLSPFEEDEAVRVLPRCSHAFHVACIDSWLLLHGTCPLCRVQISALDVEHDAELACNTTRLLVT